MCSDWMRIGRRCTFRAGKKWRAFQPATVIVWNRMKDSGSSAASEKSPDSARRQAMAADLACVLSDLAGLNSISVKCVYPVSAASSSGLRQARRARQ